ncbi:hypothetical protein [uncultured Tolumonas sp.]|uniref:hypothetical protein n=1 Tax=uncultured Tolumonas sp. TaxID=263765 RepID=UPI002A0A7EFF|nr:hypothetical protein [uncultured Tolumonas sp.]
MTFSRLCRLFLLTFGLFCFPVRASTDNYAQQAQQTCQTLLAYRTGSLLDIQVTEVKPLAVQYKWLVTGEVKKQKPAVTFACLLVLKENKMELEKLELFQVKQQTK